MSLRVIFDESHGEQFSFYHLKGLSYVLEKLKIVAYRLIAGPITLDKITNEDALFLGAPTKKFLDFEIKTLGQFISMGKSLIIVCPTPIPFGSIAVNEVIGQFGVLFKRNMVQDKKHNLDGAMYFPMIKRFEKDLITKDIKQIVYSGCSIKMINAETKPLALSDDHAEPPSVPILTANANDQIICIGGSTLFQDDDRYGIKAKNNIRLVANLFRAIQRRHSQSSKETQKKKQKKRKSVSQKKAKKYFEKLAEAAKENLENTSDQVDRLYEEILDMITAQNFALAKQILQTRYSKLKYTIEGYYQELMEKLEELNTRIKHNIDLFALEKDSTDAILVLESEVLSKLDMIRFNLLNRISKEKLRT